MVSFAGLLWAAPAGAVMQELPDDSLSLVHAQALFVADKIAGNLTGSDALSTPFTYYRLGIDGDLAFNMNINKLQLGCGGFNEGVVANACDLDIDFMRLTGTDNSDGPTSDFVMERPYLELAIKNDGDKTRREVVGIKIGAEVAMGLLSMGRTYTDGATNQEWGTPSTGATTCNNAYGQSEDNGSRLNCHSGANRISGFVNMQVSGRGRVIALGNDTGACFGNTTTNTSDKCGAAQAVYTAMAGTRMAEAIVSRNMTLYMDNCIRVLGICVAPDGQIDIREDFRMLHAATLNSQSKDFFLSFQRERLRWPIYNYSAPYDTDGFFPIGTSKNGDTTNRAYHYPANTGWWMNISYAEVMNVWAGTFTLGLGDALDALAEGTNLTNFGLGQVPLDNCFGSQVFC